MATKRLRAKDDKFYAQLMLDALVSLQHQYPQHEHERVSRDFLQSCNLTVLATLMEDPRLAEPFKNLVRDVFNNYGGDF